MRVWDVSTPIVRLIGHTGNEQGLIQTVSASWSRDCSVVLTVGAYDRTARIWDPSTGENLALFTHEEDGYAAMWSSMHPYLSEVTVPNPLRVWNYKTAQVRIFAQDFDGYGVWSPDGRLLYLGIFAAPEYHVYDAKTGTEILSSALDGCSFSFPAAWSPDGQYLAHPCLSGELPAVLVTEVLSGATVRKLKGHTDGTVNVAWSPDGSQLAIASRDQTVRVWDFQKGETVTIFAGHTAVVFDVSWSPDGTRLVSGDTAGNVRIWEATSGQEVNHYNVGGSIITLEWSPDGTRVLVTGIFRAPEIRPVWQSTEDLIAYAKEYCIFRELTDDERELFGLPAR